MKIALPMISYDCLDAGKRQKKGSKFFYKGEGWRTPHLASFENVVETDFKIL
jgi:hypothetical protein